MKLRRTLNHLTPHFVEEKGRVDLLVRSPSSRPSPPLGEKVSEGRLRGLPHRGKNRAFTLIEVMVVVAIFALIAMIGIPAIYHAMHPESLTTAANEVVEACAKARARAIWESKPVDLRWEPRKAHYEIADAPQDAAPVDPTAPPASGSVPTTTSNGTLNGENKPTAISGQISDRISIEMLDVNFRECKDDDEARVRFYPNGTCDEFTMVLTSLDTHESKKITLELVTSLAEVTPFP